MGKQPASKYPLDTSSSCGKSSDLFIAIVLCLWLVGWLVDCLNTTVVFSKLLLAAVFHVQGIYCLLLIDSVIC